MKPIVWVVFIVVLVVSIVGTQFYKNRILNKLLECLKNKDYSMYYKTLDSLACKYLFAPFNREYMRLNAIFMQGKEKPIREQFELLFKMRLGKKQDADVSFKAFYFYVDEEDKSKAKEMVDRLKRVGTDEIINHSQLVYDVFLDHKSDYIELMEEEVKNSEPGPDTGLFQYMLALQYSYLDNSAKARENLKKAQETLKGTPYEIKIKNLLKTLKK